MKHEVIVIFNSNSKDYIGNSGNQKPDVIVTGIVIDSLVIVLVLVIIQSQC